MIQVCDAIMGMGKTSSAIEYMNRHRDKKVIYITPYLDEAARIKNGCPELHFVEPSDKIKEFNFKKSVHTAHLIKEGRNIATTHQAFMGYTQDVLADIKKQGYMLIIDENVDVLEPSNVSVGDLQLCLDAGYIKEKNSIFSLTDKKYNGDALREMFNLLRSRELIKIEEKKAGSLYYWSLPPELITAFDDVIILTYLFRGQSLYYLLEMYKLPYKYIGIERYDGDKFRFCEYPGYTPEYVSRLKDMIHILDNPKMNDIGKDRTALSMNWFKTNTDGVSKLKKNVYNYFNNIWSDVPADEKLWGSYNSGFNSVRGKGYTKSFLTFNTKATNKYKDKKCLVYITNIFMNVGEKTFYQAHGLEVNEDIYALSIMVQWIWRSAIRDGQEVYIYIPSKRMRDILKNWIEVTSKGGSVI